MAEAVAIVPWKYFIYGVDFRCEHFGSSLTSHGVFYNDDPLHQPLPLLLLQLGLVVLVLSIVKILLKPLKQPRFVAEMVTGILLGPTFLHKIDEGRFYPSLFNHKYSNIMNVLEAFGFIIFSFVVGTRTDLKVIKTCGKLSILLGVVGFFLPLSLAYLGIKLCNPTSPIIAYFLNWVAVLVASTSFQVTSILLEDLKLLNSEIGRHALSSSLISSIGSWVFMVYATALAYSGFMALDTKRAILMEICRVILILIIIFVLRPFMFWIMRKIPEGMNISEVHFFMMMIMFIVVCIASEFLGVKSYFGAMVLGLAVPSGPPLGSGLAKRLEVLISAVLLPAYIIDAGRFLNLSDINMQDFKAIVILFVLALLGKFVVALLPWFFSRMPLKDSFILALILSSQGFFDLLFFKLYMNFTLIPQQYYAIIVILAVLNTAIVTPLIHFFYDPSKRYVNYKRRTIQQSNIEVTDLRIVVCIHEEDHCFSLMNVLQASNPTLQRPIGAYVLDLMELVGRDHPVFINHQFHKRDPSAQTRTNRMINAFKQFELYGDGAVRHQHFTAITPYASMHDDVCTLALQRNASLLLVPFSKSQDPAWKGVARNVLDKAPCSVGLVVDKKIITRWRPERQRKAAVRVCVIFMGGPDSREALAYGMRMVGNPSIKLKVIRLIAEDEFIADLADAKLDLKAVTDYMKVYKSSENTEYMEVSVKDGAETSQVILSIEDDYDFILVGRRVDSESQLVSGLADWSSVEELGIVGEILASSDMKSSASIVVLQQQSTAGDSWKGN